MTFLKYIFYRVYTFYNKKWPKHDPEQYGWHLVSILMILWLTGAAIFFNLYRFLDTVKIHPKISLIIITFGIMVFFYIKFLHRDKYFENTIFRNRRLSNTLCWTFVTIPFLLIILGITKARAISQRTFNYN